MKSPIRLDVSGEKLVLEWDGLCQAYVVNVKRDVGYVVAGERVHALQFLGRIGPRVGTDGVAYWENDGVGCVKDKIVCDSLEMATERLVLLFQREHPRAS